jgi:hypothetical protein
MTAQLVGAFNTGIQRSWVIIDNSTLLPVDFGGDVLDLEDSPIIKDITIEPISTGGYDVFKTDRAGWKGTITIARNSAAADLFEAVQEALYHSGGTQKYFTIVETTVDDNGTIDQFQITGCDLRMQTAGMAKKDSAIEVKLDFRGQAKQPVT